MIDLIYIISIFSVWIIIAGAVKDNGKKESKYSPNEAWPFEKQNLTNYSEQVLYFRLCETLPELCILPSTAIKINSHQKGSRRQTMV